MVLRFMGFMVLFVCLTKCSGEDHMDSTLITIQDESSKTQRQHACPFSNQSNDVVEPHMMEP